jgi:hypothetical protein
MAKTKISEWSATPANNTDIDNINIAEGCAPSGINDAIREMMAQIKDLYAGTSGDIIAVAAGGTGVGTSTGSGSNVLSTSPTLVTPALGTPSALVGTNITGTATSFNINGTVGATTPTTGAFTTLAASGSVTLSGGTANGVAYLNGSKVVTSGSALQFDGSRLLVGTTTAGVVSGGIRAVHDATEGTPTAVGDEVGWVQRNFNSSQACSFAIVSGTASTSSLYLGDKDSINVGSLVYSNSDNSMRFNASGSEQMRLTSTGLGIGTSSPAYKLQVIGASNMQVNAAGTQQVLQLNNSDTTAGTQAVKLGFSSAGVTKASINAAVYGNDFMTFNVGSDTERMRIDASGNVGIGTSSPIAKLDVFKTATVSTTDPVGNNVPTIQGSATTTSGKAMLQLTALSSAGARSPAYIEVGAVADYRSYMNLVYSADSGNAGYFAVSQFSPAGASTTERLRIDNAGNLGLSVTPSAWGSGIKSLQVGNYTALTNNQGGYVWLSGNAYYDTGWKYLTLNRALYYAQDVSDGGHKWFNAPSGTAGNAITFTQAMTLDASGKLGIGTTSPSAFGVTAERGGSDSVYFTANSTSGYNFIAGIAPALGYGLLGMTTNHALAFLTNNTERARIDSSGNFMIGTTTPVGKFTVDSGSSSNYAAFNTTNATGGYAEFRSNGTAQGDIGTAAQIVSGGASTDFGINARGARNLIFGTNNTERARIDSSGNLLAGKTSSGLILSAGFEYNNTSNNQYLSICNNGGSSNYPFYIANIASGSTALAAFYSGSTLVGSITYNGSLTLYNTTSDQRLKENIQDADSASSLIDSLQVRKFDWKKDNSHQRYGFVAQELVTVAPEAVHQPNDPEEMMAVDYSKLVPMLVKEIQSLRKRLADAGI